MASQITTKDVANGGLKRDLTSRISPVGYGLAVKKLFYGFLNFRLAGFGIAEYLLYRDIPAHLVREVQTVFIGDLF